MILLFVIALLAFQLAGATPQQTPSPTTAQTPTPTVPTPPSPPLDLWTSTSFVTTGWPTQPVSTVITSLSGMNEPWAVRILLKPTSIGNSNNNNDLPNAIVLADSQTGHSFAVARWNRNGLSDAQRNSPVRNVTYFLNQPLPGVPAQPGMVGLAAIYANTTTLNMYANVRRALGFAQKNEFTHLLLYADNNTSVKEFDVAPAEPDVPLGPGGIPAMPPNYAQSPLSPYGGSINNVPPTYRYIFPFLDGIDLDALQLFRLVFKESYFSPVSVIILESNTGSHLASLLSSNQRAKTEIEHGMLRYSIVRPRLSDPPLEPSKIAAIIAGCALILLGIVARILYVKVLLGRTALARKEEAAIVAAVQHALELRYQSVLERRARVRATMPKPIKPDLDDIATVVLDKFNMAAVLTRTAAVQSGQPIAVALAKESAPAPAFVPTVALTSAPALASPLASRPALAPNLEHDPDIDIDIDIDSRFEHDSDFYIDGYDDEGHANPLAHARHLIRRNADTDAEPLHPLQSAASHESCSICIDEFAAGDTVRVLPACHHVFHADCIDPWLTTTSALCPLCKSDTRSAAELDEYNAQLALAKLSEASPDTRIREISVEMLEFFEQVVDDISVARLGHTIKQMRPVTIIANYDHTARIACEFTTTHFIRDTLSVDDGRRGWFTRFVQRYRQNHPQVPLKLDVIVQHPARSVNRSNEVTTAYPPTQSQSPSAQGLALATSPSIV